MMASNAREWVERLPVGELFDLDDAQRALPDISRDATKAALSRLCRGDDPSLARVCKGIYTRRRVGARYPARLPVKAIRELPWRFAGPGAGVTGPYAHQQVRLEHPGLTTPLGGHVGPNA